MSSADSSPRPLIIFLHLPKTGGTTLRHIIRRQYPPGAVHAVIQPRPSLARLRAICQILPPETAVFEGHMAFGAHQFLARSSTYITLLRNPVDRVISAYYYILSHPANALHEALRLEGASLKEYASSGRFPGAANRQTGFLCGRGPLPEPCTADMLETAKRNLREYFSIVGLTERFDEMLIVLKRTFGWRSVLYTRQNVATNRPAKDSVDRDTLRAIEHSNRFDLELYDYARSMFEEQLGRQPLDSEIELEAFKRVNGQYPGAVRLL
jgi:hypothetical protein